MILAQQQQAYFDQNQALLLCMGNSVMERCLRLPISSNLVHDMVKGEVFAQTMGQSGSIHVFMCVH